MIGFSPRVCMFSSTGRDNEVAGHRIALLRHGAARAASRFRRLRSLAHLGLHHQLDVGRKFGEGAGHHREEAADLGERVAMGMPCDFRLAQVQLLHQFALHFETARAERGKSSDRAAELADQHARP